VKSKNYEIIYYVIFLYAPVTSSSLGANIPLRTLFLYTINLYASSCHGT